MISHMLPTPHFKTYANLAAPVVMETDDPLKLTNPRNKGRPSCLLYAGGAGTMVIRPCGMGSSNSRDTTVTFTAGKELPIECEQIVSGTATVVTVFWARG
jgi:hypothetical protein